MIVSFCKPCLELLSDFCSSTKTSSVKESKEGSRLLMLFETPSSNTAASLQTKSKLWLKFVPT